MISKRGILAIILWTMGMGGMVMHCGPSLPQAEKEARILVVHSYHAEFAWTHTINEGIMALLGKKGYTVQTYFMDSKRFPDDASIHRAGQHARDIIASFKPDVVIASDDNAQQYVGKFLVNRKNVALVFCGVNEEPSLYGYPGFNVTGIRELPMLRSTIHLLKKICPRVKSFTVITSKGATSAGFIHYLKDLNLDIQVDNIIEAGSFHQWKVNWLDIKSDAIITYEYHTLQEQGGSVDPTLVLNWSIAHLKKPVIGFFIEDIQAGFLLGHVQSGFEQGEQAAKKAIEIINGKKAVEIPITYARGGLVVINANTASRLGIDIAPIENIADEIFYQ